MIELLDFAACLLVIALALKTRAVLPAFVALEFSVAYLMAYTLDQYLMADFFLLSTMRSTGALVILVYVLRANWWLNVGYLLALVCSGLMYAAWVYYAKTGSLGLGNVAFVVYRWGTLAAMGLQLLGVYYGRNNGKRVRLRAKRASGPAAAFRVPGSASAGAARAASGR